MLAAANVAPALAAPGDGTMTKEEVLAAVDKLDLTPLQQAISLWAYTERSFTGKTTNGYSHDNKKAGTYVGAISGKPVFESSTKYDSGTGWPSFYAAVPGAVIERQDPDDLADKTRAMLMGGVRTEVIDAVSGAHLGHGEPPRLPLTHRGLLATVPCAIPASQYSPTGRRRRASATA